MSLNGKILSNPVKQTGASASKTALPPACFPVKEKKLAGERANTESNPTVAAGLELLKGQFASAGISQPASGF